MKRLRSTCWLWAVVTSAGLGGCLRPPQATGNVYDRLQNADPGVRADAVVEAGQARDRQAVPLLIDRLSDSEPDVRLLAAVSLRKITGEDFGWRAWDASDERQQAIERWRRWQSEQIASGGAAPATRPK